MFQNTVMLKQIFGKSNLLDGLHETTRWATVRPLGLELHISGLEAVQFRLRELLGLENEFCAFVAVLIFLNHIVLLLHVTNRFNRIQSRDERSSISK